MSQVRPPAVAGAFYPGDETRLAAAVRGYLEEAAGATGAESRPPMPKAIIIVERLGHRRGSVEPGPGQALECKLLDISCQYFSGEKKFKRF